MQDKGCMFFSDIAIFDGGSKTAISVRDGVLEYLGSEIGMEPSDKVFRVYRSPATIANVAMAMNGVPLTDEHVDLDSSPSSIGKVIASEMIDYNESGTDAKLAIKNTIDISAKMLDTLANKNELSLGYKANLVPHDVYDFEQKDIEPHHLAVVSAGRCGHGCKFIDKRGVENMGEKQHAAFLDAEGTLNLEQIVEIAMALPEALKMLPIDKLQEVLPQLQAVVEMSKAASGEPMPEVGEEVGPEGDKAGEGAMPDTYSEDKVEEEVMDEEKMDEEEEDKKDVKDEAIMLADTAEFKDAVAIAIKEHASVVDKAVQFIDDGYSFADKSADDIMRDAVATQHNVESLDSNEIKVAFKLLKKESKYKNFGDQEASDPWSKVSEKEIG